MPSGVSPREDQDGAEGAVLGELFEDDGAEADGGGEIVEVEIVEVEASSSSSSSSPSSPPPPLRPNAKG